MSNVKRGEGRVRGNVSQSIHVHVVMSSAPPLQTSGPA